MAIFAVGIYAQPKSNDVRNDETKPLVVKTVSVRTTNALTFVATAYSLRGKMANGQQVHAGAIAADPRILPIGTIVRVDGMGTFVVKDTGGAIKGRRLDIWMKSRKDALHFGRRNVTLRIISYPKRS